MHFDLVVVGSGSGNTVLGREFREQRVALIESGTFGGTCLNVGCIPTKSFVYPADLADAVVRADRLGLAATVAPVDWAVLRNRIFHRIDEISAQSGPFRLRVQGSGFDPAARVYIGTSTVPWPSVTVESDTRLTVSGTGLKDRFPVGVAVAVTVVNPDGRSATKTFRR